ncbi:MAG TPA: molybdenum ABC transporter ATP-binding protein [Candidatus Acidoferrum sp.]
MLSVSIRKKLHSPGSAEFVLRVEQEFAPGFTVLFGPSGAGKSTLLDCIAGLMAPDDGTIKVDDDSFFDSGSQICRPAEARRIAYVFQSLALFPHLSVQENVAYGLANLSSSEREERIRNILPAFHIEHLRHRRPAQLSGGEKQRVAVARSLVTEPRVLLLDEPLTGLDSALRRSILQDLRAWNAAQRIPILYVTHNREEVDAIGERVVALANGRIIESGLPRDVLDAPRSVALASAAGFENLLRAKVGEHRAQDGVMRVALAGSNCELEIPLSTAAAGTDIQVAIRAGDILLASEAPHALSARNILRGTLESLESRGTLVVAAVNAGARFTVHLTPGAVRHLQLAPGAAVWLVIKTHSCHVVA